MASPRARWRALAVLAVLVGGAVAHGDGGTLRASRASGPFVVSVFTSPEPLRAGPVDISVLAQARDGGTVVLDATVALQLRAPDGTEQRLLASHGAATNRLLQAATVELPVPGRWLLDATVRRGDGVATVAVPLDIAVATPRLAAQWPALALPGVCVLLFMYRQRTRRRPA
jgi:hypothetical protein